MSDIMAYESLLDKIKKGQTIECPKCKSTNMTFMQHLKMYGGYICQECNEIWSINDAEIKKQSKKVF